MRAKKIYESINFERNRDPKSSLDIGYSNNLSLEEISKSKQKHTNNAIANLNNNPQVRDIQIKISKLGSYQKLLKDGFFVYPHADIIHGNKLIIDVNKIPNDLNNLWSTEVARIMGDWVQIRSDELENDEGFKSDAQKLAKELKTLNLPDKITEFPNKRNDHTNFTLEDFNNLLKDPPYKWELDFRNNKYFKNLQQKLLKTPEVKRLLSMGYFTYVFADEDYDDKILLAVYYIDDFKTLSDYDAFLRLQTSRVIGNRIGIESDDDLMSALLSIFDGFSRVHHTFHHGEF